MSRRLNTKLIRNFSKSVMSSKKSTSKKSKVHSSATRKRKVNKPVLEAEPAVVPIPDIEDVVLPKLSYYSPLQTRQQRIARSSNPLDKLKSKLVSVKNVSKVAENSMHDVEVKAENALGMQLEVIQPSAIEQKPTFSKYFAATERKQKVQTTEDIPEHKYNSEWSPPNWENALQNIRVMRLRAPAPVDKMGCHQCADNKADEKTQRFHKLVALMLSSQTKDETTYAAMERLKEHTLTPTSIAAMPTDQLEKLVHPVSFYKNKAKYLKQTSQRLIDDYDSDIPNTVKDLMLLPGVGPKMAHICMATSWQQITGIGVDVHVHRISNRLGWVQKPTKEPEQTRVALESWLPHDLWAEVNHLFVGFGQTVCTPLRPNCAECLNAKFCPAADVKIKDLKNKKKLMKM